MNKIRQKGIDRLKKLGTIYIHCHVNTTYFVFYKEKEIVKFAQISNPFYLRHGPRVDATLRSIEPTGFWQYRLGDLTMAQYDYMLKLFQGFKLNLPELNVEDLEYEE